MKNRKIIAAVLVMLSLVIGTVFVSYADNTASNTVKEDQLFELENCSHSGMTTKKVSTVYASGGEYIVNNAAGISNKKDIIVDDLSFMVNMSKSGSLKVFLRVQFPGNSPGSFFYRWDDSDWQQYNGYADKNFQWAEIKEQYLSEGMHKFSICRMTGGVCFDAGYVTRDLEYKPSLPEGVELIPEGERIIAHTQDGIPELDSVGVVLEAEELTYEQGMIVVDDLGASGKSAIKVKMPDQSSPMTAPNSALPGTMEYEFVAAEDCGFSVWFRVYANGPSSDSAYVAMDGITNYVDHAFPHHNVWYWKQVITRFEAKKGETYKFKFHFREKELMIDQIIITAMPGYEPVGAFGNESSANKTDSPIVTELKQKEEEALEPIWGMPPYSPPRVNIPECFSVRLTGKKLLQNSITPTMHTSNLCSTLMLQKKM